MFGAFYAIGLRVFLLGMKAASLLGFRKARQSLTGRRDWVERLSSAVRTAEKLRPGKWIHIHCASLGEFEQGAPVMSALRERVPDRPILLTFFSPSGVESVPADTADHVDYLPFDTAENMRWFHQILPAADTVLVKNELWPNLLEARLSSGGQIHLIAACFDNNRYPMNPLGRWARKQMARFSSVLVQDAASADVIAQFGIHAEVAGDPRMDRVIETFYLKPSRDIQAKLDQLSLWAGDRKVLVAGSAWSREWEILRKIIPRLSASGWCLVYAPHEINVKSIRSWASESGFPRTAQYLDDPIPQSDGLILDEIGLLKHVYALGHAAIVGGGWGSGVHNTLEPSVFGLPTAVGPRIAGFREIRTLQSLGALTVCPSPDEMIRTLRFWMSDGPPENEGKAGANWILSNSGAAESIASRILGV